LDDHQRHVHLVVKTMRGQLPDFSLTQDWKVPPTM
jgi:hypothetical protein